MLQPIVILLSLSLLLTPTTTTTTIDPPNPTFQLHVLQTPTTLLSCGGLVHISPSKSNPSVTTEHSSPRSTTKHPSNNQTYSFVLRNNDRPVPTYYPLLPGPLPYLALVGTQNEYSPSNVYHVLFDKVNICTHFMLDHYTLLPVQPTAPSTRPTIETTALFPHVPPLVTLFVLHSQGQDHNTRRSTSSTTNPTPPTISTNTTNTTDQPTLSAAQSFHQGAQQAWHHALNTAGLPPNMTTAPLIGKNIHYGIQNITTVISLIQTHLDHRHKATSGNQEPSLNPQVLDSATKEGNVFRRENPFSHSATHPTSSTNPCVPVTLTFINCVKRHAQVNACAQYKSDLLHCRAQHAADQEAASSSSSSSSSTPRGFSFRACTGAGGKCPASGGTPDGATAKELGVPARPPVYSPTPLGPDLSDAGGSMMMSVVEMCIGTSINTLVKKFALYSRKKINPMLQLALIDGVPSMGNMEAQAVPPGTVPSKPSAGDAPQGDLASFKPGAVPASIAAALAAGGGAAAAAAAAPTTNGAGQPSLGMAPKPDPAAGAPKPSPAAAAAAESKDKKDAMDASTAALGAALAASALAKDHAAQDISAAKVASSKAEAAEQSGSAAAPAALAAAAVLAGTAEKSAMAAAQAADMAEDASKANAEAAGEYAKAKEQEQDAAGLGSGGAPGGGVPGNGGAPSSGSASPSDRGGGDGGDGAGGPNNGDGGDSDGNGNGDDDDGKGDGDDGQGDPQQQEQKVAEAKAKEQKSDQALRESTKDLTGATENANAAASLAAKDQANSANSANSANGNSGDSGAASEMAGDSAANSKAMDQKLNKATTAHDAAAQTHQKDVDNMNKENTKLDALKKPNNNNHNHKNDNDKKWKDQVDPNYDQSDAQRAGNAPADSLTAADAALKYDKGSQQSADNANAGKAQNREAAAQQDVNAAQHHNQRKKQQQSKSPTNTKTQPSTTAAGAKGATAPKKASTAMPAQPKPLVQPNQGIDQGSPDVDNLGSGMSNAMFVDLEEQAEDHDNDKDNDKDNDNDKIKQPATAAAQHGRGGGQPNHSLLELHEYITTHTFVGKKVKKGLGSLTKIMTGELLHVFTALFTKRITDDFTEFMTPAITAAVSNAALDDSVNYLVSHVGKMTETTLPRTLSATVPTALNNMLPSQLLKSLTNKVEETVVRSLVHAVAPTISHVLAPPPKTRHDYDRTLHRSGGGAGGVTEPETTNVWMYEAYYADFVLGHHPKK